MKCEEVEAVLTDYLDGTLDQETRGMVEKHLESCERCLDLVNESQRLLGMMASEKMETPGDALKINFYNMLHGEMRRKDGPASLYSEHAGIFLSGKVLLRIAASVAILITGAFLGVMITLGIKNSESGRELAQLKTEVAALKKSAMLTMLKEESSSNRILAMDYAAELKNPDENVIKALFQTLNTDRNVNVRMAAAYALAGFAGQKAVSDSLVQSLRIQTDPILQVTLINILVEKREKSALEPMKQIVRNAGTLKEVREVAEKGIKVLL